MAPATWIGSGQPSRPIRTGLRAAGPGMKTVSDVEYARSLGGGR